MSWMSGAAPAWLDGLLAREEVTDICLNGAGAAYADSGRGLERVGGATGDIEMGPEELRSWVLGQLSAAGRSWDAKLPFADAALPSGHRLHVAFPPLSRAGIAVSLRRLASPVAAGAASRWCASPEYALLAEAIRRGDSLLLCGSTGSGKTTLASDLLSEVPPGERIIAIEDTPELAPRHPHFLSLVSRPANADGCGEVGLRALLRQTLRMRPDRIVLGECRGAEVLDLLQLLNTGHKGAMATLHANSPRDALRRAELLCQLEGAPIPQKTLRELLAHGIQWLAHLERDADGTRRISELCRVEGMEQDTILTRPVDAAAQGVRREKPWPPKSNARIS